MRKLPIVWDGKPGLEIYNVPQVIL